MSGVSIGWFDPTLFNYDIGYFTKRLRKAMPVQHKHWPLQVSSIRRDGRGTGVAYAIVDGHIPLHIDQVGLDDSNGQIFQFVLEAENRPMLTTAASKPEHDPRILGLEEDFGHFGLGAMELKVGMAVHFDITTTWHAIGSLPVYGKSMNVDVAPRLVIVQVAGFEATQIGDAVEHARELVHMDRGFWDAGRRAIGKGR